MSNLEIHTRVIDPPPAPPPTGGYSSYVEALLHLIPAEVIAAYLTIQGIVGTKQQPEDKGTLLFIAAGILFAATPFVVWKLRRVKQPLVVIITTIAFPVWLFATAGPLFSYLGGWWAGPQREKAAAVSLVLFVFMLPFFLKPERFLPK